jgi:hypothetical protein
VGDGVRFFFIVILLQRARFERSKRSMLCCRSSISSSTRCSIRSRLRRRTGFVLEEVPADFRFIVALLRHGNGLGCIADLDAKCAAGRRDAEILIAETPDQVERLLRGLLLREPERVGLHLRFDRRAHVGRRAKESIRGDRAVDALVRPLEVVVLHEERDSAESVCEVGKHGLAQKLLPQRLPEALDLPERLGVLRSTLAVRDAIPPQQLLELRLAAPRRVLPPLVGEHLARMAVLGDAALERLDDKARLVVMRHRPRHDVARVVVHEADDVDALMAPELEREDVGLPELIRLRAFKAAHRLVARCGRLSCHQQPCLVKNPSHRGL